jgi:phytanoyl-CoA hydroxylase
MHVSNEFDLQVDGFLKVQDLASSSQLMDVRRDLYRLINGEIDLKRDRCDLAPSVPRRNVEFENIAQIKYPGKFLETLKSSALYNLALALSKSLLGADMALAFDMIFFKAPHSATPTPFHQDSAYWPSLPDARALSCWIALDDVNIHNGCLWFIPGSHLQIQRPHYISDECSGTLACEGREDEAVAVPLMAGSCTFHLGDTIHYSRGNLTDGGRGALVLHFRPVSTIVNDRC